MYSLRRHRHNVYSRNEGVERAEKKIGFIQERDNYRR